MGVNVGGGFFLLRTRENNWGTRSNWDNTWERDCDDDGL